MTEAGSRLYLDESSAIIASWGPIRVAGRELVGQCLFGGSFSSLCSLRFLEATSGKGCAMAHALWLNDITLLLRMHPGKFWGQALLLPCTVSESELDRCHSDVTWAVWDT